MSNNTDPILLKEAVNAFHTYGSKKEAARQLGIARSTLQGRLKAAAEQGLIVQTTAELVQTDDQLQRLRQTKTATATKYRTALQQLDEHKITNERLTQLDNYTKKFTVKDYKVSSKKLAKNEVAAILVTSDWHFEEDIRPETINGLNEYNLQIAVRRIESFFQKALKIIDMYRNDFRINTLVFGVLGDLINGYIHEEFEETNLLSPPEACTHVFEHLANGINYLLDKGNFKEIIVPMCVGNHGRTTKRTRSSTRISNSYEFIIYNFLVKYFAQRGDKRIKFQLPTGYFNYLDLYGHTLRFHHGDSVRYQGGVGGVHIPLNKAIAQWNRARKATLDILGHWHTLKSDSKFLINGSIVGYNSYCIDIKAEYEEPQQGLLIFHPEKKVLHESKIYVEEK